MGFLPEKKKKKNEKQGKRTTWVPTPVLLRRCLHSHFPGSHFPSSHLQPILPAHPAMPPGSAVTADSCHTAPPCEQQNNPTNSSLPNTAVPGACELTHRLSRRHDRLLTPAMWVKLGLTVQDPCQEVREEGGALLRGGRAGGRGEGLGGLGGGNAHTPALAPATRSPALPSLVPGQSEGRAGGLLSQATWRLRCRALAMCHSCKPARPVGWGCLVGPMWVGCCVITDGGVSQQPGPTHATRPAPAVEGSHRSRVRPTLCSAPSDPTSVCTWTVWHPCWSCFQSLDPKCT